MRMRIRYDDENAVDHPLYERFATVVAGAPGRCPECETFGYIDHADRVRGVQAQHCRACGYRWEYEFDADGRIQEVREIAGPDRADADTVLDLRAPREPGPRWRVRRRTPVSRR